MSGAIRQRRASTSSAESVLIRQNLKPPMKSTQRVLVAGAIASAVICQASLCFGQGSLTPPSGSPTPTMKTLDQVQPRIPLDANHTPGDSSNQFIISQSGSYYLTGSIAAPSGKNGIRVNANDVSIDL